MGAGQNLPLDDGITDERGGDIGASGMHAFAFQNGAWLVSHRKLRERLAGSQDWYGFSGRCQAWELMSGAGNVEDHWIGDPDGAYTAATFRRLEPDGTWSIWWSDSRRQGVDSPMVGSFKNGVGSFFGKDMADGKPIDVRFIWSDLETSPQWEQAFSQDGGKNWETNWLMTFRQAP